MNLKLWYPVYANDNDAYIPELWAQESLMILESNMVAANLVHRDFENQIAQFGDVVNTRRPGSFTTKRKADTDSVTDQDATATNVQVPLDQHLYNTFIIKDGEESKGFKNLVAEYLEPAVMAIAHTIDEIILYQVYQFLANNAGKLDTALSLASIVSLREAMSVNKCPLEGRNLILSPAAEADLLSIDTFVEADKVGDAGMALREASLGRKLGFNMFVCHNVPSFLASSSNKTASTITEPAAVGDTSITLGTDETDSFWTAAIGSWITIEGDMIPHQITGFTAGTNVATIYPAIKYACADNAVVTVYDDGAVDLTGSSYAAGWNKPIVCDSFGAAPSTGQMVTTGTAGSAAVKYGLLKTPAATSLLFDRSLEAALADNAELNLGPQGNYNFAFHKNAVALVTRPLATPMPGTGALSYVANYKGLGIRVTITYSGTEQGHRVTVDLLAGVKVLDTNLGAVLFS